MARLIATAKQAAFEMAMSRLAVLQEFNECEALVEETRSDILARKIPFSIEQAHAWEVAQRGGCKEADQLMLPIIRRADGTRGRVVPCPTITEDALPCVVPTTAWAADPADPEQQEVEEAESGLGEEQEQDVKSYRRDRFGPLDKTLYPTCVASAMVTDRADTDVPKNTNGKVPAAKALQALLQRCDVKMKRKPAKKSQGDASTEVAPSASTATAVSVATAASTNTATTATTTATTTTPTTTTITTTATTTTTTAAAAAEPAATTQLAPAPASSVNRAAMRSARVGMSGATVKELALAAALRIGTTRTTTKNSGAAGAASLFTARSTCALAGSTQSNHKNAVAADSCQASKRSTTEAEACSATNSLPNCGSDHKINRNNSNTTACMKSNSNATIVNCQDSTAATRVSSTASTTTTSSLIANNIPVRQHVVNILGDDANHCDEEDGNHLEPGCHGRPVFIRGDPTEFSRAGAILDALVEESSIHNTKAPLASDLACRDHLEKPSLGGSMVSTSAGVSYLKGASQMRSVAQLAQLQFYATDSTLNTRLMKMT